MKAKLNKKTLRALDALSPQDRIDFFHPREESPSDASIRYLLFCVYYFPATFYNKPSPSHEQAGAFFSQTRHNNLNEFLWVGAGGVGKTMHFSAETALSILYNLEPLTVYQSAVQNNTYSFVSRVLGMITTPEVLRDYGPLVSQNLIGAHVTEKKRSQKRTDFTFKNGCRVVASNLFSSVRGWCKVILRCRPARSPRCSSTISQPHRHQGHLASNSVCLMPCLRHAGRLISRLAAPSLAPTLPRAKTMRRSFSKKNQ